MAMAMRVARLPARRGYTCKDLEASIRFYRDAIGFAVVQTYEHEGKVVAAVCRRGGRADRSGTPYAAAAMRRAR